MSIKASGKILMFHFFCLFCLGCECVKKAFFFSAQLVWIMKKQIALIASIFSSPPSFEHWWCCVPIIVFISFELLSFLTDVKLKMKRFEGWLQREQEHIYLKSSVSFNRRRKGMDSYRRCIILFLHKFTVFWILILKIKQFQNSAKCFKNVTMVFRGSTITGTSWWSLHLTGFFEHF